ncbi:MAG TPA: hypothetical protein PKC55_17470 [Dysgonomonas sp.]|nr:hypothetical protein [Dysgonomonas sp.]HML66620.1 hypothetical protein [Dysgonomonas sp.]
MTEEEVRHFYPNGIRAYEDIIEDRHLSLWQKGAWTMTLIRCFVF